MIGDSKILTVSYGTFSCTLEGFDDPFSTMKSIAEYFRDLAADDRYFGAEPPTPDAAMLHRIAEREVSRMVEARVQDNSMILRQHDAPASMPATPVALSSEVAAPIAPQPAEAPRAVEPAPEPQLDAAPAVAAAVPVADTAPPIAAAAPEEEPEAPALNEEIPGGVAAKLARIRQSVSYRPTAAPLADEDFAAPADVVETTPATAFLADEYDGQMDVAPLASETDALPEDFAAGEVEPADLAASTDVDDVLARLGVLLGAPKDDEPQLVEAPVEEPEAPLSSDDLSVAADDESVMADATLADSIAAAIEADHSPTAPLLLSDALVEEVAAADDAPPLTVEEDQTYVLRSAVEDEADTDDWDTYAEADELGESPEPAPDLQIEAETDLPVEAETVVHIAAVDATPEESQPAAALLLETSFATEDADGATAAEDFGAMPDAMSQDTIGRVDADAEMPAESPDVNAEDPTDDDGATRPKRAHARVIRIRRADEDSSEDDAEPSDDPTRPLDPLGEDAAMSRLMRLADDEMQGTENRRRLSAIAHLKAAVAATEAERAVTGEAISTPGAKIGDYRDDLAHAVQPLPPEVPEPPMPVRPRRETVSVRPKGPRPGSIHAGMLNTPPPLVLISEQRIDRTPPTGQPMVAVRPGRLTGAIGASAAGLAASVDQTSAAVSEFDEDEDADDTDNIFSDDAGFTEFAEKLAVKSVPDLLEAAAAYATCIENRAHFTRPQLMRRLTAATVGKPVSREDGLRSFGTLLRTGRIEKVSRGQYALADSSPYLVEARRMAL
jgi:hypothetical protein